MECGGKEGDVTLLDCTNTEERGEEEEEGKKLVHCRLGGPERNSERKVLGALGIFLSAGVLVICCCC